MQKKVGIITLLSWGKKGSPFENAKKGGGGKKVKNYRILSSAKASQLS